VSDAPRDSSRALDVLTAVLLGLVSLTTALGAWQAGTWSAQAKEYGSSSADARDVSIVQTVAWQYQSRLDAANVLQARKFALLEVQSLAGDDFAAAAYNGVMVTNHLGRVIADGLPEAFESWRSDGFPADQTPTSDPVYIANLRGDADSYALTSAVAGQFKDALEAKAGIFTQAALIDALALFLLGVAGINRLRAARFATLVLGGVVFLASLVLMATAY
jgi:hypothetical protein